MNKQKQGDVSTVQAFLSSELVLRGICKSPSHLDVVCLKFLHKESAIKCYSFPKPFFKKMSVNLLCYLIPLSHGNSPVCDSLGGVGIGILKEDVW